MTSIEINHPSTLKQINIVDISRLSRQTVCEKFRSICSKAIGILQAGKRSEIARQLGISTMTKRHLQEQGVQRRMISVVNCYRNFEIIIFCFVVAICDLVHAVEATYGLP